LPTLTLNVVSLPTLAALVLAVSGPRGLVWLAVAMLVFVAVEVASVAPADGPATGREAEAPATVESEPLEALVSAV
jgi:hypothetical protein